jgi:hypothetical protein
VAGTWFGAASAEPVAGHGVDSASVLASRGRAARCRVPWAYLRHARNAGVSMKPCGHGRDELNQISRLR